MPRPITDITEAILTSAVSGTYINDAARRLPSLVSVSLAYEEVRLDVDGWFPQMMASGSYYRLVSVLKKPTHWVATIRSSGPDTWEGQILKVWGDLGQMPHKYVRIHVPGTAILSPRMTITFEGGDVPAETRTLRFATAYFRQVTVEFDTVENVSPVTSVATCAHNDRPADLRCETLAFDRVWDRAGVEVVRSSRRTTVPLGDAGADQAWQDAELHAAMRKYWSAYSDAPRWGIWVLFAGTGRSETVMGSMFDDSDANQRQGVGIFNDAFERNIDAAHPQRPEHMRRERFFGLMHETGHCFNLHHAWLSHNPAWGWPYWENAGGNSATFMNYPDASFYSRFRYEFDDSDLKFVRHAPEDLVQMGDARFYRGADEFGRESDLSGAWALQVDLPRRRGVFEFLEPVTVRVTLRNTSRHPQIIDEAVLEDAGRLLVAIRRNDSESARLWRPFAQHCYLPSPRVIEPGGTLTTWAFLGAGLDGWYLAEPGSYTLHAALVTHDLVVAAPAARLRIACDCGLDQQLIAQDLFTRDVGRAFAFGASHAIEGPVAVLREVLERIPDRAVARHAGLALAEAWKRDQRVLHLDGDTRRFERVAADAGEAQRLLKHALQDDATRCFGDRYPELLQEYRQWAERHGAAQD